MTSYSKSGVSEPRQSLYQTRCVSQPDWQKTGGVTSRYVPDWLPDVDISMNYMIYWRNLDFYSFYHFCIYLYWYLVVYRVVKDLVVFTEIFEDTPEELAARFASLQ